MDSKILAYLLIGVLLGVAIGVAAYGLLYSPAAPAACTSLGIKPVFSPGSDEDIVPVIEAANSTIEVEMFTFTYEPLIDALVDAKARGVDVRIILEPRLDPPNRNIETKEKLEAGGVEVKWASTEYKLTHSKFAVVDGKVVVVGSVNWSRSGMESNREASVVIFDEETAGEFLQVFEEDWEKAS